MPLLAHVIYFEMAICPRLDRDPFTVNIVFDMELTKSRILVIPSERYSTSKNRTGLYDEGGDC